MHDKRQVLGKRIQWLLPFTATIFAIPYLFAIFYIANNQFAFPLLVSQGRRNLVNDGNDTFRIHADKTIRC